MGNFAENLNLGNRVRPPLSKTCILFDLLTDIVFGSGAGWKAQRKFFLTFFRGFGVGQSSFEKRISDEVSAVIEMFSLQPFNPRRILANATANVTCNILLGRRYDYNDSEFNQIYDLITTIMELNVTGGLFRFLPILDNFNQRVVKLRTEAVLQLHAIIQKHIDEHKERLEARLSEMETADCTEEDRIQASLSETISTDCIDAYLLEMKQERLSGSTRYFTEKNLICNVVNVFIAGMETSANTLAWCLLYVATHTDTQSRLQKEIDAIGQDRMVALSDEPTLPYVQATICEVQRIRPVTPLGAPHSNPQEATINGFTIPKDTMVVTNIWAMHHDQQLWREHEKFQPERFLKEDEAGSLVVSGQEKIIPFSVGKCTSFHCHFVCKMA